MSCVHYKPHWVGWKCCTIFTALRVGLTPQQGPTDNKGTYFEPHKITFLKKILPCKKTAETKKNIFLLTPKENSFFTSLSSNVLCSQSPNIRKHGLLKNSVQFPLERGSNGNTYFSMSKILECQDYLGVQRGKLITIETSFLKLQGYVQAMMSWDVNKVIICHLLYAWSHTKGNHYGKYLLHVNKDWGGFISHLIMKVPQMVWSRSNSVWLWKYAMRRKK